MEKKEYNIGGITIIDIEDDIDVLDAYASADISPFGSGPLGDGGIGDDGTAPGPGQC